jgi:hypothetical protein
VTELFGAPRPARRSPGPVGKAILVVLWLVIGVMPIAFSISDVRLASGAVGTPGTLTVEQCTDLGRGRYDCVGTFVPAGDGTPIAVDATPDSTPGESRPAQLSPEGDRAVPNGTAGVLAALTLPLLGVAVLGLLPAVVMWGVGRTRNIRPALFWGAVVAALGTAGVVVGMVAAYS